MAADGSFTIDAKLQTKDFTVSSKQLMTAIKNLEQSSKRTSAGMAKSASSYGNAMRTSAKAAREFNAELKRLENEAANLKSKLNEKGNRMIATDDFKQLIKDQQKAQTEYDKLIDKKNKMKIAGVAHDSKDMDKLYYDIAKAESKMDELRMKREEMLSSGKAYVGGKETAEYAELEMKYNAIADKIQDMREASQEAGSGFQIMARNAGTAAASLIRMVGGGVLSYLRKLALHARNAAIQLMKLAGNAIKTGIQKIGQLAGGAAKKILGLGKATSKSNNGFKVGLMTVLKYGLGIRSLYFLFRRLRQAITDGFNAIAQKDPQVKAALNSLQKALNGLKGSLATAFAPILTAIAPALTTLINLLTTAINAIGAFFAALTGKKTFAKSVGGLEATGKAAKGASGSVKELKNQLAGFDELEILKDSSGSGGGSGGGGSDSGPSFEMATIDSGISEFAEQLKAAWNASDFDGVGKIIANKINGAFEKAKKLISWDNIGGKVVEWIDKITGIFNGLVDGINWPLIGSTFATGTNTIVNTLNNWWSRINTILPKLAKGLVTSFNQYIEDTNFFKIGQTFALKIESIIRSALIAIKTFDFGNAGKKLGQLINGFFENSFLWDDAANTVAAAIRGILDFTKNFVITFDAKQAADKIKGAFNALKAQMPAIAKEFWDAVKEAFSKADDFLAELFGVKNGGHSFAVTVNGNGVGASIGHAVSTALSGSLTAIANAIKSINWENIGLEIRDALENIDWVDVARKLWTVFSAIVDAIDNLLSTLIFGKDYKNNSVWQLTHQRETKEYLRSMIDSGNTPDFENVPSKILQEFIDEAAESGQTKYIDALLEHLPTKYESDRNAIERQKSDAEFSKLSAGLLSALNETGDKRLNAQNDAYLASWAKMAYNELTNQGGLSASETIGWFNKLGLTEHQLEVVAKALGLNTESNTKNTEANKQNTESNNKNTAAIESEAKQKIANVISEVPEKFNGALIDVYENIRNAFPGLGKSFETPDGGSFDDWWDSYESDLTKSLDKNTKSTDKGTKEQSKATKHEQLAQKTGAKNYTPGAAKSWSTLEAEVPVNLTPGKGGTSGVFASVGDWIKKSVAGGADSPIRANLKPGTGGAVGTFNNVISFIRKAVESGADTPIRTNLVSGSGGARGTFQTVADFLRQSFAAGADTNVRTTLVKADRSETVNTIYGTALAVASTLSRKKGSETVASLYGTTLSISATISNAGTAINNLANSLKTKLHQAFPSLFAQGGIITSGGMIRRFAAGGAISSSGRASWWNGIPKYASGTGRAHGTLFAAGEAGPEVVGHIGGRTEVLNKSQLAQTMHNAVVSGIVTALSHLQFRTPAMASGTVMPYEIIAQQERLHSELRNTLDANNEDLINTIISVVGQQTAALVSALAKAQSSGTGRGLSAQEVINEINRRTQMFSASPLKGV